MKNGVTLVPKKYLTSVYRFSCCAWVCCME